MKRAVLSAIIAAGLLVSVGQARTIYVNGTTGSDNWTGLCEVWDGGTCGPKRTIQAGIFVALHGDTVQVADGTYTGDGNIDADPLFVDPDIGDFHLLPDSPCIGTGDPGVFGLDEFDIDSEPRVMGGRVDMGADEFTDDAFVYGNTNCDDARDSFDIDPFVLALTDPVACGNAFPDCFVETADINGDGVLDAFDIDPFVELLTGS